MKTDPEDLGISIKFPIEDNWGCSFLGGDHSGWMNLLIEKFDGGDYWSEFEGLTAETKLIAAIRMKFLLLWEDLNYWGNWTSQVTEGLKDILHPVLYQDDQEIGSGVLTKCSLKISPGAGWEEQRP